MVSFLKLCLAVLPVVADASPAHKELAHHRPNRHSHRPNGTVPVTGNSTCTSLSSRKAWHTLDATEKNAYVEAVQCMMKLPPRTGNIPQAENLWDEFQYAHLVQSNFIHGTGSFLPWHRLILRLHEKVLQEDCGYTGGIPYWHEQRDYSLSADIADASVFDSNDTANFGSVGVSFASNVTNSSQCVVDGSFANTKLRYDIWLGVVDFNEYCMFRNHSNHYWSYANQTYVDECNAKDNYQAMNMCFVQWPHICGHLGVGGTMGDNDASPGEPLFYLHHANLDRLWWKWQKGNLTARTTQVVGSNFPPATVALANGWLTPGPEFLNYSGDPAPGTNTTLNHVLWSHGIYQNVTIADVMDLTNDFMCTEYIEADDYAF